MAIQIQTRKISDLPEITQISDLSPEDLLFVSQKTQGGGYSSKSLRLGNLSGSVSGGSTFFGYFTDLALDQGVFQDDVRAKTSSVVSCGSFVYGNVSLTSDVAVDLSVDQDNRISAINGRGVPSYVNTSDLSQLVTVGVHPNCIVNCVPFYQNVISGGGYAGGDLCSPMTPYPIAVLKPYGQAKSTADQGGKYGILQTRTVGSFPNGGQIPPYQMDSYVWTSIMDADRSSSGETWWHLFGFYGESGTGIKDSIYGAGQPVLVGPGEKILFLQPGKYGGDNLSRTIVSGYPDQYPGYLSVDNIKDGPAFENTMFVNANLKYENWSFFDTVQVTRPDAFCSVSEIHLPDGTFRNFVGKWLTISTVSERDLENYQNYRNSLLYLDTRPQSRFLDLIDYEPPQS